MSGIVLTESCSVAMEISWEFELESCVLVTGNTEIGVLESNSKLGELISSVTSTPSLSSSFISHAITMGTGIVGDSSDWLISSMDKSL